MNLTDLLEEPESFLTERILFIDSDHQFPQEEQVFGHIISGTSISFGNDGWRQVPHEKRLALRESGEGRFAAVFDFDAHWVVKSDSGLQEQIYFYAISPENWMISTSLFLLAIRAKQRGMPLTRDPRHMRLPAQGMFAMLPHTWRTPFAQISRVPTGAHIALHKDSRRADVKHASVSEAFSESLSKDLDTLASEFIADAASNIRSLMESRDYVCDLTGGYDSRLVFAISRLSAAETGTFLRTFSNSSRSEEFQIAREICSNYGLDEPSNTHRFPRGKKTVSLTPRSSLQAWLLFAFDGKNGLDVVPKLTIPNGAPAIQATGHVAAASRFSSALSNLQRSAANALPPADLEVWREELEHFVRNDIFPNLEGAGPSLLLFLQSYAANHSGGNWRWLLGGTLRWTPLTSEKYIALHLKCAMTDIDMRRIQPSLLSGLAPELAELPHNKESETWPEDFRKNPIFRLDDSFDLAKKEVFGVDGVSGNYQKDNRSSFFETFRNLLESETDGHELGGPASEEWKRSNLSELASLSEDDLRQRLQGQYVPGLWVRDLLTSKMAVESKP